MLEDEWVIRNERCDPPALGQFNSVCTISNGYLGIKGNLQEDHDGYAPVTLIHGVYDELDMFGLLRPSKHERPWLDPEHFDDAGKSPAVANLPNPLFVSVFLNDRQVDLRPGRVRGFRQELDLRTGCYSYRYEYDDGQVRVRIEAWRFASLLDAHRAYMRYRIIPRTPVRLRILSGIDARVCSNLTGERQFIVEQLEADGLTCRMQVRTPARGHEVWLEVENRPLGIPPISDIRGFRGHDAVFTEFDLRPEANQPVTLDRFIALWSSEDRRHAARLSTRPAPAQPFDQALAAQRRAWDALWGPADVQIHGDARAQEYLRFCLYHLLAAAPRFSDRLSVPVKLLSGDYYQGNTFWDTDVYIVPFYTFTSPHLARTCLYYRYAGLESARHIAAALGHAGAKFAWQAGPYGEECLGPWYYFPRTNIHINADVLYSLMQYCRASGDEGFLYRHGIDMLVESARFYSSRAVHRRDCDTYHFEDVAGPDEAHCHSADNFYTNYLAKRTLLWAADVLRQTQSARPDLYAQAVQRLRLSDGESARWRRVAEGLALLFDPNTNLYEQCAGFYQLPQPPADLLSSRRDWFVPLYAYQALNQPDVLMAVMLFRDDFPEDVRRANWEYYKDKSMNFSSMSFPVNAIMAADLGDTEEAYRNFVISAGMDLDESLTGRHDTHAGLHGTAMGGAWMAAIFGFGGLHVSEHGLRIEPRLPAHWDALGFNLMLRGESVRVTIDQCELALSVGSVRKVAFPMRIGGEEVVLRSGHAHRCRWPP